MTSSSPSRSKAGSSHGSQEGREDFAALFGFSPLILDFGYFNTEWGSLVQIQQENFSNVLKAQKKLAQGLQQVLNVQTYMLNDVVGDSARILQELTGEATPEQKMSNQMGCLRAAYDRIMDKNRQAQDILNRTQSELLTLMVRSADETVQELGSGSSAK